MLDIFKGIIRVAVIDDAIVQAEFMTAALRKYLPEGSEVITFTDPDVALKEISTGKFFAVFTDIHMDQMKGDDLIRHINSFNLGVQSYVLTSDDGFILAINCFHLGCRRIFLKPVKMKDVKDVAQEVNQDFQRWHQCFKSLQESKKNMAS